MKRNEMDLCLIYWGRKGGGKRLFQETVIELNRDNQRTFYISARNEIVRELLIETPEIRVVDGVFSNRKKNLILEALDIVRKKNLLMEVCKTNNISNIVIVMSSPLDVFLRNKKRESVLIWRVLHDAQPHPGDLWPSRLFIKYFRKSSKIITLSQYVSNQIGNTQAIQTGLNRNVEPKVKRVQLPSNYVLIAGRTKRYKNLDEVLKVVPLFPDQNFVVVASTGKRTISPFPNLTFIDKWLEDAELEFVISKASALIAAYSESSQSGIVEQAVYWKVPVLCSDRGGMREQLLGNSDGIVLKEIDVDSIKQGLRELLQIKRSEKSNYKQKNLSQSLMNTVEFTKGDIESELP